MERNADLYIIRRSPLIQAINQVLSHQSASKKGIILSALGLVISCLFYWHKKKAIQKVQEKISHLSMQDPLNKTLLLLLDEQWRQGDYNDNFTFLLPQYKQLGRVSVFKNVYVYLQMDNNIQLGKLKFCVNSSNLECLLRNYIPRTKLTQYIVPNMSCFQSEQIHVDFARRKQKISSMFLRDFNEKQINDGLLREIKKNPNQGQLVLQYLTQKAFKNDSLFKGTQLYYEYPDPLQLRKSELLCLKCSVILKNNQIRITNIKAIANDFTRLKLFLKSNYQNKISVLQTGLMLSKILINVFGLITIYQVGKYLYNALEPFMLKKEYRGLDKVKNKLYEVYCDGNEGLKCIHCKISQANFIFVPCYHLQCCKKCFAIENQIECNTCKTTIHCGIPIFVSK